MLRCSKADVGYPVTHLALTGEDATVLAGVRELAASSVARQGAVGHLLPAADRPGLGSHSPLFRARFFALSSYGYQGRTDEAAFDYTWGWFELMRAFFRKSADEGRRMVFTADQ